LEAGDAIITGFHIHMVERLSAKKGTAGISKNGQTASTATTKKGQSNRAARNIFFIADIVGGSHQGSVIPSSTRFDS